MKAALLGALLLSACSQAAHPYPGEAYEAFMAQCTGGAAFCACAWEEITHTMTAEEFEAAQADFATRGIADHRIVHARAVCQERTR